MILPTGKYRHYKGKEYLVLGVARHSETGELLVVYVPLYTVEGPGMSVRPLSMFTELVDERDGAARGGQPRFEYVGDGP